MTITADFSGGEKTVTTEPLYQWDTGQKLALSGLPATSTDIQVHFANAAMAQAIVKATELVDSLPTCDIPNEFLQFGSAAKARAWVFYRTSNTEGYTVRTVLIPVTPRKRPNDYVSPEDPDSQGIVDRAIELLEHYQSDLNAKEEKSNKKTTLTGNESSNDFYPTTKAVADALSTKAPASTAYTFDRTTTTVVYNANNPKIIYTNALVNGKNAFVLTTSNNYYQIALCADGTEYTRQLTSGGSTTYNPWLEVQNKVIAEEVGDLKSAVEALPDQLKEELFPNHINHIADVDWELESGGINNSTGEELANSSYTRTGFVSLNPNFTFTLRDKNGNSVGVVYYYDTNKTFMSAAYGTNSIKKTNAVYARFQMTKVYDSETTLPEFLEGFWGLKSDYDSADIDAPRIYTSDYEIVEANRLAKGTKIPSDVIEAELTADRLTAIIQNSNVNLLDRTKLETGYSVDGEGNVVSTTGSQRLMRAMPIKPNTQYTFSLFSGWGICNPCWLNRYGDIVLNMISGTVGSSITVTSPADAFYLRFNLANDANTGSVMIVEGDTLPSSFVAYNQNLIKLKTDLLPENITVQTFGTVEANKLADEVKAGQATINKLTTPERLTTIIENNSVNLFDKSKLETGYNVDTSGNIITSGVGGRVMRAMPILPNTAYTLSVFNYLAFINPCWLDSYGETVISMISGTNNEPVTVTSPSNAYYLRFGFAPATVSAPQINNAMIVKGNSLPTDYVDYDSNAIHIKKSLLPGAKGNKDWSGMKYIAFGDSRSCGYASKTDGTVTWDDDESGKNNYPEMIGYYTGISVDNRAAPGGAFANRTAGGQYNLSFDYFTENLPTDADIITIFLGTNDRVIGSDPANLNPTEERDDQTNLFNAETFKGAIRNGLKKIRQKMPEVPIILMVDDRGFNATAADGGTTRADMIREVAREAGLPVFDIALKAMNQDTLNDEIYNGVKNKYWYHTDILHESILGNKMLAKALAGEMAKYLW